MKLKPWDLWIPNPVWRMYRRIRYPVYHYRRWRKWHDLPSAGEKVVDCRGLTLVVSAVDGDNLTLEDGSTASWMHCCDRPET